MTDLTSHWRPAPQIRPKAIGILWRGDAILVCAVPNDDGTTKGWRPLGGTIEFGETAAQTLKRELFEEIGATVSIGAQLGVIENIYTHQGEPGHEIMFVYKANLIDPGLATAETCVVIEDNGSRHCAAWVPIGDFTSGDQLLFPKGLFALL